MNKVIITNARLTRDVNLTFAAGSGNAICKFGIAVNRRFKKGESDFLNCVAFGKQGEIIAEHFQKGSPINIEGEIRTGNYTNTDGKKVYTTDIIVSAFEFISGGKKKEGTDYAGTPFEEDQDGDCPF